MKAKRLFITILSLTLSLVSCGESKDEYARYKITESQFNTQCNRDYVLVGSNYTIEEIHPQYGTQIVYFDYGKIKIGSGTCYKLVLENNIYKVTTYPSSGSSYDREMNKQEMYNFFFIGFDFLFDTTYKSLTFNKEQKCYDTDVSIFDAKYNIESLSFHTLDGVLQKAVATINRQNFIMNFYDIGTTKVDINEVTLEEYTLTYNYSTSNNESDKQVIDYVSYILEEIGISNHEISAGSGVLTIKYKTNLRSDTMFFIDNLLHKRVNQRAAITNAHDEVASNLKFQVSPGPKAIDLYMECFTDDIWYLMNTIVIDMENSNTEYAVFNHYYEEDSGEAVYLYPLFVWGDYDEDICTFDNYVNAESRLLMRYFFSPSTFKLSDYIEENVGGSYTFYLSTGYMDSNGDGIISNEERDYSIFAAKAVAAYINIQNTFLQILK